MYLVLIGCSHVHVKIKIYVLYLIPSPTKHLENMSGTPCPKINCGGEMEKCDVCETTLICHRCIKQCDCDGFNAMDLCVWSCNNCLKTCEDEECGWHCCVNCVSNVWCCGRDLCNVCAEGMNCEMCGRMLCNDCTGKWEDYICENCGHGGNYICEDCRKCEYCEDHVCQGCAVHNKSGDSCHAECLDKRRKDIAVELGLTPRSIEPRNDPLHRADGGGLQPDMTDMPLELRRLISKQAQAAETQFSMLCI